MNTAMKKNNAKKVPRLKGLLDFYPGRLHFGKTFDEISELLPNLKYIIPVQEGYMYREKKLKIFFCFDENGALVSVTSPAENIFPNMDEDIPFENLVELIGACNLISVSGDGVEFKYAGYNFYYAPHKTYDLRTSAPVIVSPV